MTLKWKEINLIEEDSSAGSYFTVDQTWGQIHWNVFKYKYSWGFKYFEMQKYLNTNTLKSISNTFPNTFQICFTYHDVHVLPLGYLGKDKQIIYWDIKFIGISVLLIRDFN